MLREDDGSPCDIAAEDTRAASVISRESAPWAERGAVHTSTSNITDLRLRKSEPDVKRLKCIRSSLS